MACNVFCGAQLTQLCPCFFRLPLVGAMGPLDCLTSAASTRMRIERKRAEPQAAQRAFLARDTPPERRGQREKNLLHFSICKCHPCAGPNANLLCIVPILTDDPRRESDRKNACSKHPRTKPFVRRNGPPGLTPAAAARSVCPRCLASPQARTCTHRGTAERYRGGDRMRMPGVEPGSQAWGACVIPLHYMRLGCLSSTQLIWSYQ